MNKPAFQKLFVRSVSLLLLIIASNVSLAGVVVIVSASNGNAELNEKQIYNIYLGKSKKFPDGVKVLPIDQAKSSADREVFREAVLKKSSSQLNAYWSRLIFTGKGTPPQESGDSATTKKLVADNPNLIGYIDASDVDETVKVIYKL